MPTERLDPTDFVVPQREIAELQAQAKAAKSLQPCKPKHEIEFYQFPKAVMDAIARSNYMPALRVAMAVYKTWFDDFKKYNPVKLTSARLTGFGISKDQKMKALQVLEKTNQFLVDRSPGRSPSVMMKWKLVKEPQGPGL